MEYDTERAGGFEPLRLVPKGKKVVLGLVTSKTGKLESKDEIKRRVEAATKYIDHRPALSQPAMRLCQHRGRQSADRRRTMGEARLRRRSRRRKSGDTPNALSARVNAMQANTDRIQTTHVGSLVRPPELVDFMRKRLEREAVDDAAYERYLTSAVAEVVERQAAAGLTVVNDGEYPKSSWYRYVTERLDGLEFRAVPSERPKPTPSAGLDFERFRDFYAEYQSGQQANAGGGYWVVTGPIKYRGHEQVQRDIANLKARVARPSAASTGSCRWSLPQACCKACATNITAPRRS